MWGNYKTSKDTPSVVFLNGKLAIKVPYFGIGFFIPMFQDFTNLEEHLGLRNSNFFNGKA